MVQKSLIYKIIRLFIFYIEDIIKRIWYYFRPKDTIIFESQEVYEIFIGELKGDKNWADKITNNSYSFHKKPVAISEPIRKLTLQEKKENFYYYCSGLPPSSIEYKFNSIAKLLPEVACLIEQDIILSRNLYLPKKILGESITDKHGIVYFTEGDNSTMVWGLTIGELIYRHLSERSL